LLNKNTKINYDAFQRSHNKQYKTNKGIKTPTIIINNSSSVVFENILNYIFWDIEDLIRKTGNIENAFYSKKELETDLLKLLLFIEKWILVPVGLKDYFMESRQLDELNISFYIDKIINHTKFHFPYTSIESYFYNLRLRLNIFLRDYLKYDQFMKINNSDVRLIDSIINVQNYSIYMINKIKKGIENDKIMENSYKHPNKAYYI